MNFYEEFLKAYPTLIFWEKISELLGKNCPKKPNNAEETIEHACMFKSWCEKIEWNELTSLPEEICNLPTLTNLFLAYNHIRELPEKIQNSPKLGWISLQKNPLSGQAIQTLSMLQKARIHFRYDL